MEMENTEKLKLRISKLVQRNEELVSKISKLSMEKASALDSLSVKRYSYRMSFPLAALKEETPKYRVTHKIMEQLVKDGAISFEIVQDSENRAFLYANLYVFTDLNEMK